jgi:hypothetical protein
MSPLRTTLAFAHFMGLAAICPAADPVDWDRLAKENAQQDFTTNIFDGKAPDQLACDKGGRLNYPDGFVSKDGAFLNFAFDDNRHRCVFYRAKLPPLPAP